MSAPDRPHNFTLSQDGKIIFCTQCGHIALDRTFSTESQINVDAQRIAKQACPRMAVTTPTPK